MSLPAALAFDGVAMVVGGARLFDNLDFAIAPGERVAIIGGSGTGKSMLLRLAAGLTAPSSGQITLFGQPLADLTADQRRLHRTRCGMAFQQGSLIGGLSVEDNLWLGLGAPPEARRRLGRKVDRVLLEFGIEYAAHTPVDALSSGERRRVELARAFVRDPELVMLDEPLDGVTADAPALEAQFERQIVARGKALLLMTQDAGLAMRLCDRQFRLARGRLVQHAAGDDLPVPAMS